MTPPRAVAASETRISIDGQEIGNVKSIDIRTDSETLDVTTHSANPWRAAIPGMVEAKISFELSMGTGSGVPPVGSKIRLDIPGRKPGESTLITGVVTYADSMGRVEARISGPDDVQINASIEATPEEAEPEWLKNGALPDE